MKPPTRLETAIAELAPKERVLLERFKGAVVEHPRLLQVELDLLHAIWEPAGFACVLLVGPTGVGKSTVLRRVVKHFPGSAGEAAFGLLPAPAGRTPVPLLVMEPWAQAPWFNRAYYYRTGLRLLGEATLGDWGTAQAGMRKGRTIDHFQDLPELRQAYQEALARRQVRVVLLDEAQHLMQVGAGAELLEQLDWLKSMTNATGVLHLLSGPYSLLQFSSLSGQAARRGHEVHFARYQYTRPAEQAQFQGALLALLKALPLPTDLEGMMAHWQTCYERTIGCIGVLRDWLARALAIALHSGSEQLTWERLITRALPVLHCHRLAKEAIDGERALTDTEEQRRELWELLLQDTTKQGGASLARAQSSAPTPSAPPAAPTNSEATPAPTTGRRSSRRKAPAERREESAPMPAASVGAALPVPAAQEATEADTASPAVASPAASGKPTTGRRGQRKSRLELVDTPILD